MSECQPRGRLRLNPTETEVTWLGASQQVNCVNASDIPVLSTSVTVAESPRDLSAILDTVDRVLRHCTVVVCVCFTAQRTGLAAGKSGGRRVNVAA